MENFPGFPAGVDGFELMNNLRKQATKFGARVENAFIDRVDFSGENKILYSGEKSYEAKVIIIATGAAPVYSMFPAKRKCTEVRELLHVLLAMELSIETWMWW